MFGVIFLPFIFSDNNVSSSITLIGQILSLFILLVFARYELLNTKITSRHLCAFILGVLMVFCVFFAPINEFVNQSTGMIIVGVGMGILLLYWRYYVLKIGKIQNQNSKNTW